MFTLMTSLEQFQPRHGATEQAVFSRLGPGRAGTVAARPGIKGVLEGEEIYRIDGRAYPVRPGEFLLVDAGQEIEVEIAHRGGETIGLCLDIPAGRLHEAMAARLGRLDSPPPVPGIPNIVFGMAGTGLGAVMERLGLLALGRAGEALPLAAATAQLADLVLAARGQADRLEARRPAVRLELLRRLERARSYLHAHTARAVSLDELASATALSKYHLSRSFRRVYGQSPAAYHSRLRLAAVRESLAREDVSLSELALRFGFADAAGLSRAFNRVFGLSPGRAAAAN